MNNFLSDLNPRERGLLLIAIALILSMSLIFGINSSVNNYSISIKNLEKAKSDYEYVYLKARTLENTNASEYITNEGLDILIKKLKLTSAISNINILDDEGYTSITFNSDNLKDAVTISENIANISNMKLNEIIFTYTEGKIAFKLLLD
tara:strand:+ start:59 stop:505 length:447 start_codon:yes stop_codon:yes gene_type:complete